MSDRNSITEALLRLFTPETAAMNFGSPQDDPDGWMRAVDYQRRLADATRAGMDMPEDPRLRAYRGMPR